MTFDPCKDETLLNAFADDELSPQQTLAVRRHLESCPACRKRLEGLQQTDAMIQSMAPATPSPDFDRTFWRKVAELEDRRRFRSWRLARLAGWRPLVASGLAAAAAALIFIYTGQDRVPTPEEIFISQNVELFENYDIIDQLDMLEQLDAIEAMKEPS